MQHMASSYSSTRTAISSLWIFFVRARCRVPQDNYFKKCLSRRSFFFLSFHYLAPYIWSPLSSLSAFLLQTLSKARSMATTQELEPYLSITTTCDDYNLFFRIAVLALPSFSRSFDTKSLSVTIRSSQNPPIHEAIILPPPPQRLQPILARLSSDQDCLRPVPHHAQGEALESLGPARFGRYFDLREGCGSLW